MSPTSSGPAHASASESTEERLEPPGASFTRQGKDNPSLSLLERWRGVIDTVRTTSMRHAASLMNAHVVAIRQGEVVLGFGPDQGFHRLQVASPAGKTLIEKCFVEHFGRPTKLLIDDLAAASSPNGPTLAEQERQGRAARERSADDKVRTHPSVLTALRILGGELEHVALLEPEPAPEPIPAAPDEESA